MAGEIHHVAAQAGQASPGGRLDPPLLMALDEIVQTCPVPLPTWLADSGGKGIQLIPVAHGEAQLRTRWGKDGAQVVLDTCGVKVWLPGITDTATLKMASDLCGQAAFTERVRVRGRGEDRDEHRRVWHDVMTPDMIRQLPAATPWSSAAACRPSSPGSAPPGKTAPTRPPAAPAPPSPQLAPAPRACPPPARPAAAWPRGCAAVARPGPRSRRATGAATTPRPTRGADGDDRRRHRRPDRRAAPARRAHREARRPRPPRRPPTPARSASASPRWPALVNDLKATMASHAEALAALDEPGPAGRRAGRPADGEPGDGERGGLPAAARAPGSGSSTSPAREEAIGKLRAWVEQVYRPGYGHLAASLGDCWDQHPLCLYILDWLSELWSVLYLQPRPAPRRRWPGRPSGTPGCCPPRPSSSPGRPAAAATPATRRHDTAPDGSAAMTARPDQRSRRWPTPRHGWPVFPCQPGSKEPATRHGFQRRHHRPGQDHLVVAAPARTPTSPSPPARPAPTCSTSTSTARPATGSPRCSKLDPRRAGSTAPARSSPRPAAGCTPTSPAPTSAAASCPATTSTSARRAATSSPRPPRSAASPTGSSATRPKPAAWTGPRPSALLEPQRQAAARPASAQRGEPGPPRRLGGRAGTGQPQPQRRPVLGGLPGRRGRRRRGPGRAGRRRPVDRAHRTRDRRHDRLGPPYRRTPLIEHQGGREATS